MKKITFYCCKFKYLLWFRHKSWESYFKKEIFKINITLLRTVRHFLQGGTSPWSYSRYLCLAFIFCIQKFQVQILVLGPDIPTSWSWEHNITPRKIFLLEKPRVVTGQEMPHFLKPMISALKVFRLEVCVRSPYPYPPCVPHVPPISSFSI
jgi:hypothetical protein